MIGMVDLMIETIDQITVTIIELGVLGVEEDENRNNY